MLDDLFLGSSLMDCNGVHRSIEGRHVSRFDAIDCYRNLNRTHCFSIRSRQGPFKGLVTGYGRSVVVQSPHIVISDISRQRVVREGVKNVHAYIRGQLFGVFDGDLVNAWQQRLFRVSYSPYVGDFFYQLQRDPNGHCITGSIKPVAPSTLESATVAIINGCDVFLDISRQLAGRT